MSPNTSPFNPSQAVERIREIIVGRHLERLEKRVVRLESTAPAILPFQPQLEDRIYTHEAQLEALKDNVHRLVDTGREQLEMRLQVQHEETQRLAAQIHQVASTRQGLAGTEIQQMEQKIGTWLTHWQHSVQTHFVDRDQNLLGQIREEVAALWESTETHITRVESRLMDRDALEERFKRIGLAARALAECASPSQLTPVDALK